MPGLVSPGDLIALAEAALGQYRGRHRCVCVYVYVYVYVRVCACVYVCYKIIAAYAY